VASRGGGFGTGWTKLLGSSYGPEIGWLYPLALLALVFGLIWTRRAKRTDQTRAGFVMWGVWLVSFGLVFSEMSTIPHTAYMAALAAPLAALSAAGIVMFGRLYRAGDRRGWILPVAVAAEVAWALFLWRDYGGFLPWARAAAVVAGVVAVIVLVGARLSRRARARLVTAGLTAGVAAMLAAPTTWAASVLDTKYGGSSFNASAGPDGGGGPGGGGAPGGGAAGRYAGGRSLARLAEEYGFGAAGRADAAGRGGQAGRPTRGGFPGSAGGPAARGGGGGISASATTTLTAAEQRIYGYVSAHRNGASYLMAVESWTEASPYILATGQEVMPMGGFSGSVPEPALARVKQLVTSGQLRFFLLNGTGTGGGFSARAGGGSTVQTVVSWVESSCAKVPARDYSATSSGASSGSALYECR
jgi:4-amino-4-deoxy-L-arabinose transferase-like glycosyltransferase